MFVTHNHINIQVLLLMLIIREKIRHIFTYDTFIINLKLSNSSFFLNYKKKQKKNEAIFRYLWHFPI